jgi:arabinose-5-phosphate isomerase
MGGSHREVGRDVVRREAEALASLAERLGPEFDEAVERILACPGRVILCGLGKSGHVAQKIASTLVSTGTPAGYLHPAEGFHGDVGIVTSRDVVVAVSNSGTTQELLALIPVIKGIGAAVVALTGPRTSPLARAADVAVCWGEAKEADSLGVVPTVSSALTLALGDALTVAVMTRRGFGAKDYALVHPSGAIGRKLTLRVVDLLRGDETNPRVGEASTFADAVTTLTKHHLGGVSVVDEHSRLAGLVTEADVRRAMESAHGTVRDLLARPVREVMTRSPTAVSAADLAFDALKTMESHRPRPVFLVPVVDAERRVVGMINLHSLMQAGLTSGENGG